MANEVLLQWRVQYYGNAQFKQKQRNEKKRRINCKWSGMSDIP